MQFPTVIAHDLDGRELRLPDDLPANPRVVIVAFQRWHQELIESWEPELERLEDHCRGLSTWAIPALSRLYLPFRGYIDGGMRAGTPDPKAREHTLTAYTDVSALAKALELPSVDTIYVLLVAPDGRIVWRADGAASAEKAAKLEAAIDELAASLG